VDSGGDGVGGAGVKWLVGVLKSRGLAAVRWYRIGLALVLAGLLVAEAAVASRMGRRTSLRPRSRVGEGWGVCYV